MTKTRNSISADPQSYQLPTDPQGQNHIHSGTQEAVNNLVGRVLDPKIIINGENSEQPLPLYVSREVALEFVAKKEVPKTGRIGAMLIEKRNNSN